MSAVEQQENQLQSQEIDSGVMTPASYDETQSKADDSSVDNHVPVDIPAKPASAYITVCLLCLMVAFGGFVFGWDTGTISGFVNMPDFIKRFGQVKSNGDHYLSNVRTGLIVSIFNIGCAFGSVFLSKAADMYGRRIGLMIMMVIYIVGILIQITAVSKWYQYFIGRIISGLAVGGIGVISPLFISESAPKHIRPALVSSYQLMITFGIFLGYCTNYGTKTYDNTAQWRIALGLCFFWALLMITGMVFMPESPRYLIKKGRLDDARKSLAYSNRVPADDPAIFAEVEEINAALLKEDAAGKASWMELIKGKPKIGYRVLCGILLMSLQQLTGNNYFFYYGTTIFQAVGLNDSFQTSIVLGIVNFASTIIAIYSVNKLGGRKSLLIGCVGMIVCFVIFASLGVTKLYPHGRDEASDKGTGNAMIFFACIYIFFFATTWGPCCFVVVSEIYPIRIKSKAMGIATASNWLWGFLIAFFTPFITSAINFYYGYVFLGCLVFAFFFVYFTIPTTTGLTLEEVDEMYATGVKAWKSASFVPSRDFTQEKAFLKAKSEEVENVNAENTPLPNYS
ncbi:sugar porter family MFS transporter [Cyberlindnera jadinii NRRL Y-1542]|uniref:General substrate transporter n=1 Tax=Cyberlindnera jadinii (strain ATCC 18201 / CBS 1600 / BCRC 20928 / JCM 3617 / NBRC 0987 / NRRL Y-1542) TaxID=983966 RepID=A0A1E4SAB0_CYBJN|nr:general substrate transporter [Cyberlindnera jadinii NRRL Y-1542]ODV76449.1 general substrate transporter [Cyberlindnera jadinii NRRL Y-1542]